MFEKDIITRSFTGVQGVHNGADKRKKVANSEVYNPFIL